MAIESIIFATAEDYAARYGLTTDEDRLNTILADVSTVMINAYEGFWGDPYQEGIHANFDRSACAVCCSIAHRSLSVPAGFEGAKQYSQTAGSYNAFIMFSNPTGDIYLSKTELKRLGLYGQRIGAVMSCFDGDRDV